MKPKKQPEKWEKEFDKEFGCLVANVEKERLIYTKRVNMEKVKSFISQVRQEAVREERVKMGKALREIARQLEMMVLTYEKDISDLADGRTKGIVMSLESKIRAFIRHELKESEE